MAIAQVDYMNQDFDKSSTRTKAGIAYLEIWAVAEAKQCTTKRISPKRMQLAIWPKDEDQHDNMMFWCTEMGLDITKEVSNYTDTNTWKSSKTEFYIQIRYPS